MKRNRKEHVIADAADLSFLQENRHAAAAVRDFITQLQREKRRDAAIMAAIERDGEVPSAVHMETIRRYAQLRVEIMKKVPFLRSGDIAGLSGSSARNTSAKASRWKSEGRIFSVPWRGVDHYPAFQFSPVDGEPLPVMQKVLEILTPKRNDWQILCWFYGNNVFTPDECPPMDAIATHPETVIKAAEWEVKPLF